MKRGALIAGSILLALLGQALVPATAAPGSSSLAEHVPGVVLVGFRPGASAGARAEALRAVGAASSEQLSPLAADARVIRLGGMSVEAAIAALSRNPNVRYAEPDYVVEPTADANDPGYATGMVSSSSGATYTTWGLYGPDTSPTKNDFGSAAGQVWSAGHTGSDAIYVGIVDTGVEIGHEDLASNIWTNPGEIAGNGKDDDGNGYVDDVNGWDFNNNDRTVYDRSSDDYHGTHVAGTIGAQGNNGKGVPGINWNVTMIPAKFLTSRGGTTSNAIRAIDYLTDLKGRYGIDLVATNNSWGGGGFSQSLLDAINRGGNAGILFIVAAGNSSANNDATATYPANYVCTTPGRAWDCVVSVASLTSDGGRSSFSNYGATTVDLAAPGSSILSTYPGSGYAVLSGTSMATPHVTGALALCASMGSLAGSALRTALLDAAAATPTTSVASTTATGGRLNLAQMAAACADGGTRAPIPLSLYRLSVTVSATTTDGVSGVGTVTTTPDVLTCSSGTCTADSRGNVTLLATPASGSVFSGWGGVCTGTATTCTVSLLGARSVTATFRPATYTATLSVTKPSSTSPYVTISRISGTSWSAKCTGVCSKSVVNTTTLRFVATTASGARTFVWGGACSGVTSGTCTVTVTGTTSATIRFSA